MTLLAAASAGFVAGASLIIAIGAQNAFILRQGLQRRHVGLVVVTSSINDIVCITVGVAGIGVLVHQWPGLLQGLRYGGAAFLAAYGLMAAYQSWRGEEMLKPQSAGEGSRRRALLACLAFSFLYPHVYLDTMIVLGSLSTHYAGAARWMFAAGASCASVAWFSALGYGARLIVPAFRNPRAWRALDVVVAAFMLTLCLLLLRHPLM